MELSAYVNAKKFAAEALASSAQDFVELSHKIHTLAETGFNEHRSAYSVAHSLSELNFEVELGYAGLPTAVRAQRGSGPFQVVLCAEYDALPEIGHACGHNIIAASSVGAAAALAGLVDDLGLELVVLGTPAEESGGGKITLIDGGAFDDAHAAMMVHPAPYDVVAPPVLALDWLQVRFEGKEAHASAFPEEGINAADALVVAQVGIGLLRQHLPGEVRVHGYTQQAGTAPNIVPALAEASYMIRATHYDELDPTRRRVAACFEAGAIATGSELTVERRTPTYTHLEHHKMLGQKYRQNAEGLGRSFHTGPVPAVSTDMGNVSLKVPSLHPFIGIDSLPATNHQPGFAIAAAGPAADRAVIDGATALAWTVVDAATDDEMRSELLARHQRSRTA